MLLQRDRSGAPRVRYSCPPRLGQSCLSAVYYYRRGSALLQERHNRAMQESQMDCDNLYIKKKSRLRCSKKHTKYLLLQFLELKKPPPPQPDVEPGAACPLVPELLLVAFLSFPHVASIQKWFKVYSRHAGWFCLDRCTGIPQISPKISPKAVLHHWRCSQAGSGTTPDCPATKPILIQSWWEKKEGSREIKKPNPQPQWAMLNGSAQPSFSQSGTKSQAKRSRDEPTTGPRSGSGLLLKPPLAAWGPPSVLCHHRDAPSSCPSRRGRHGPSFCSSLPSSSHPVGFASRWQATPGRGPAHRAWLLSSSAPSKRQNGLLPALLPLPLQAGARHHTQLTTWR